MDPSAACRSSSRTSGRHTAGDPFHEGTRFAKEAGCTEPHDTELITRFRRRASSSSAGPTRPSSGSSPPPSPRPTAPTRNPWDTDALDRRLERRVGGGGRVRAWCRSATPTTAAARSASRRRCVRARRAQADARRGADGRRTSATSWAAWSPSTCVTPLGARQRGLLDAIAGAMPGDPYTAPPPARPFADEVGATPGRLRVGIMTTPARAASGSASRRRRGGRGAGRCCSRSATGSRRATCPSARRSRVRRQPSSCAGRPGWRGW